MIEGTWRIVEDADGGDVVYLFRPGGGYVALHLDGADSAVITTNQTPGSSQVFEFAAWVKFVDHICAFLRARPEQGDDCPKEIK